MQLEDDGAGAITRREPMTPESRAEWLALRAERRAARNAKKAEQMAMAEAIRVQFDAGLTSEEVGEALGLSPRRVRRISARNAICQLRPDERQFRFNCATLTAKTVRRLAEGAGVTPAVMLERIVMVAVEGGLERARKKLGSLAIPTRPRAKSIRRG